MKKIEVGLSVMLGFMSVSTVQAAVTTFTAANCVTNHVKIGASLNAYYGTSFVNNDTANAVDIACPIPISVTTTQSLKVKAFVNDASTVGAVSCQVYSYQRNLTTGEVSGPTSGVFGSTVLGKTAPGAYFSSSSVSVYPGGGGWSKSIAELRCNLGKSETAYGTLQLHQFEADVF